MTDEYRTTVTREATFSRHWFMALGIISALLGLAALVSPLVAAMTLELLIGWILVISGVLGVVHGLRARRWRGYRLSMAPSLFALGIGAVLVLFPRSGILSLALLMAVFFLVSGVFRILLAWHLKPLDRWLWLLSSGILGLVMALLILLLWPEAAGWVIGILLGIDLLFSGVTLILIALTARQRIRLESGL